MKKTKTFSAFLRGINVGGKKIVRMGELREALESMGFQNVKTILASGNVVFDTSTAGNAAIAAKIENCLQGEFGMEICVLVRSVKELQALADAVPFRGIAPNPKTKQYVTFLPERSRKSSAFEKKAFAKGYGVVYSSAGELCIHFELERSRNSTDLMEFLDRELGRKVTTRSWNTIAKVLKAGERRT
jgi:uncharacterized protein (DUF1697 family)